MNDRAAVPLQPELPLAGQRWLVVGAAGMLGQDLVPAVKNAGAEVVGLSRLELDVTDRNAVDRSVVGFDVVVNCAAWTAVDAAEDAEAAAFAVNAVAAQHLALAAAGTGARLVQISTDYVLSGDGTEPQAEDTPMVPRSAYGRTKAAGEWAVRACTDDYLIVRTEYLYGAGGHCFPKTMARLAKERDVLTVVDDQQGQPTWTADLSDLIVRLVAAKAPSGTYHGTSQGSVTWHGFATAIMETLGANVRVDRVDSAAFAAKAARPANSVLGHDALRVAGVEPIGPWAERWAAAAPTVIGR